MFSIYAPRYWAAGISAIPLKPRQKMPSPNSWQAFAHILPDPETQAHWLDAYPDGNIGMVLGPQSGICVVDVDTDDEALNKVILGQLPYTPWIRRGKKGAVYAFKHDGERTTRIKGSDGKTIVELLATGSQVVLPPSIHPDTQLPYTANAELVDVLHLLQPLPRDLEQNLRKALIDAGVKLTARGSVKVTTWVPAGGRDSQLVAMAGLFARGVITGERTLAEAGSEIEGWVANFTENVVGDSLDPAKGRLKLMEFLRRDIVEMKKKLPHGWEAGMTDNDILEARKYFGEHLDEWALEEYTTYLTEKFLEVPRDNHAGRTSIIDDVLTRMSAAQHLNHMEKEFILQFINSTNRMMTMAAMRKRLKELSGIRITGEDHTEIAQLLVKELERYGELRYSDGRFYQWKGSHWDEFHKNAILKVLAEEFGDLKAARRHSDHKGIVATASNIVPQGLATSEPHGINFANGFLTPSLELLQHEPSHGATYVLPYRYIVDSEQPVRFLDFLGQCWGGQPDYDDQLEALRGAIAATLFKQAYKYARAICLVGRPKTGKTTLMDIVSGLVPPGAICSVPPHEWSDKFLPTQMAGKLMNICGELSEMKPIKGDRFKSIVEGQSISGQFKNENIFRFQPTCAHWFASNHLPKTQDTSGGFTRRWLFLHFTKPVRDDRKVTGLAELILAEEREAIVAWAATGIRSLVQRNDYVLSTSHNQLSKDVGSQNNSLRQFLSSGHVDIVEQRAELSIRPGLNETHLYNTYHIYCAAIARCKPLDLSAFSFAMEELRDEYGIECVKTGRTGEKIFVNVHHRTNSTRSIRR